MTYLTLNSHLTRRVLGTLLAGAATLTLAACGGGETKTSGQASGGATKYEVETDHAIGSADAPVTIVEYASVVCPACSNWANTVYPELKQKYIDTGKVRYIYRPFPTSPQQLADAGHMIALCSGDDKFLTSIKYQFERQPQIMAMAREGKAREAYLNIAKLSGLSAEEFEACLVNEEIQKEYADVVKGAMDIGITGTPGFLVNGEYTKKTPTGRQFYTLETIEEVILPIMGEPIPVKEEVKEDATEESSDTATPETEAAE